MNNEICRVEIETAANQLTVDQQFEEIFDDTSHPVKSLFMDTISELPPQHAVSFTHASMFKAGPLEKAAVGVFEFGEQNKEHYL